MRGFAWAQLRANKGRYLASALAVAVSVAFVAATLTLNATSKASMRDAVAGQFSGVDAAVLVPGEFADDTGRQVAGVPGVASATVDRVRWVSVTSGDKSYNQVSLGTMADDDALRWQRLSVGELPRGPAQAVAYAGSNFAVGQRLYVRPDVDTATDRVATEMTVVGLLKSHGAAAGTTQLFAPSEAVAAVAPGRESERGEDVVIRSVFDGSADPAMVFDAVRVQVASVPGAEVVTGTAAADKVLSRYTGENDMLALVLLGFAAITALVSALVISNTFAVLVSSRTRELALLRCAGAEVRQIRSVVRLEALILSVVASIIGVVLGIGGVAAATALVRLTGARVPLTDLSIPVTAVIVPLLLGVVITLVASTVPARMATKVSPLAAFAAGDTSGRGGRPVARLWCGAVLGVVGVAVLVLGLTQGSGAAAGFGGAMTFLAVMLIGVVVFPPLIRGVGMGGARALRRTSVGPVAELAAANLGRSPRRTSATASALIIGITLTTMMVTGAGAVRSSASALIADMHPVDLIMSSGSPLGDDVVEGIRRTSGVSGTVAVTRTDIGVNGVPIAVGAVDTAQLQKVMRSGSAPLSDEIALAPEDMSMAGVHVGQEVSVVAGGVTRVMRVTEGDSGSFADRGAVSASDAPTAVAVRLDSTGENSDHVVASLRDLVAASTPDATFSGGVEIGQQLDDVVTLVLRIVLALLAVAVMVALIGVGNTMALSVIDRRRENALLRVVGLSRSGVQAMLLIEAATVAAVASALGVLLGTGYGLAGAAAVLGTEKFAAPDMPWGVLTGIVVVGGLAGLLAAALPARHALRADPAAAL
ncbi:ABC transporter permease [Williamsia sp.]|uniref:ABC transporter permease n=1 Tax=Williamsia sp. TaxID=1872085 RepID=UPI002F953AE6